MIKGLIIFFGIFFALVALLFWVKMQPANAQSSGQIWGQTWGLASLDGAQNAHLSDGGFGPA